MPLHNEVGINRNKGETTENQGPSVKYICAKSCMLDDCVCVLSDLR